MQVWEVVAKGLLGGALVTAFAALSQMLSPKRFAGVFSAAPSVALGALVVTLLGSGGPDARTACIGMAGGAVGFVAYCLVAPPLMRRAGSLGGAGAALLVWLAVAAVVLGAERLAAPAVLAAGLPGAAGSARPRPALRVSPRALRRAGPRDWGTRFAFGAGISVASSIVAVVLGPLIGGVLLAFPAILLASLTLIREEDGAADARGAVWGAVGLVVFAGTGALWFTVLPAPVVIAAAAAAWTVSAIGLFLVARLLGGGADEQPA